MISSGPWYPARRSFSCRFCVYVDHPGGVDHALCERVTEVLDPYLAQFTVEVSSPGPERPLRKPEHFAAMHGRKVAVRTGSEVAGRRRFRGEVLAADDDAVTLGLSASEQLRIPYDAIVRAIEQVTQNGPRTADMGGNASTVDVGRAVADALAADGPN